MKRILSDFKKYGGYTVYAAKSQLRAEVANSKLNWIWWVLEPFCFMLVYSFVFGVIFNAAEPHHGLFIFVGLSAWQFFSRCVKHSVGLIKKRRQIIAKVYLPKYMLVLQEVMVDGFKMLICMVISAAMVVYYRVGFTKQIFMLVPVLSVLILFSFGVSCFVMHAGVYLDDLTNIIDIFMRFLVYFVGVFYSIPKRIPSPYSDYLSRWNPMAFIVNSVRNILIYHTPVDYSMLVFWGIVSLLLCYTGVQLIYKNENSYIKVV